MKLNYYAIVAMLVFVALMAIPVSAKTADFLNGGTYINVINPADIPAVGNGVQFTAPPSPLKSGTTYYVVSASTGAYGTNYFQVSATNGGVSLAWSAAVSTAFTVVSTGTPPQVASFSGSWNYVIVAQGIACPPAGSTITFASPPAPLQAGVNYYVVSASANRIQVAATPLGAPVSWSLVSTVISAFTVVSVGNPQQTAVFLNGGNYIYAPNTPLPAEGTQVTFVVPPFPLTSGTVYYTTGGFYHYFRVANTLGGSPVKWTSGSLFTTFTIVPTTTVSKHH